MRVSVIIPVYNAEKYISRAVTSALAQPETAEILLVEDGSVDGSLAICEEFASKYEHVRLLRHDNGENRGAGASRNLGLECAREEFVAFLDADDFYLPGRFEQTKQRFTEFANADGIYETIGAKYYDRNLKAKHLARVGWENTGLTKPVRPVHLFRTLATGKFGHIHLNGLTLKRSSMRKDIRFDTSLKQCQDSDLMLRLATSRILYPGNLDEVVALRGVHRDNRVFNTAEALHFRKVYLRKCIDHYFYGSRDITANLYIITRYIGATRAFRPFRRLGAFAVLFKGVFIPVFLIANPGVPLHLLRIYFSKVHRKIAVAGSR